MGGELYPLVEDISGLTYLLPYRNIIEDSVSIYVGVVEQAEGEDYTIDYEQSRVVFTVAPEDVVTVDYSFYLGFPSIGGNNIYNEIIVTMDDLNSSSAPVVEGLGFSGIFDGNNNKITGLYINKYYNMGLLQFEEMFMNSDNTSYYSDPVGLFGYTEEGASIENLGIEDSSIKGFIFVGGLVGISDSININNSYNTSDVEGLMRVGGLVGYDLNSPTIVGSYNSGNISGVARVGGLISSVGTREDAFAGGNLLTIENSYNEGNITGTFVTPCGENFDFPEYFKFNIIIINFAVGGLAGTASNIAIYNSYNNGEIEGAGITHVGGLVGSAGGAEINTSYNSGEVISDYPEITIPFLESIVGVGGLVGSAFNSITVENSYNDGNITGHTSVGGIIGSLFNLEEEAEVSLTNSYNSGNISQTAENSTGYFGGIVGLSTFLNFFTLNLFTSGEITADGPDLESQYLITDMPFGFPTFAKGGVGGINFYSVESIPNIEFSILNNWWFSSLDIAGSTCILSQSGEDIQLDCSETNEILDSVEKANSADVFKNNIINSPLGEWDFITPVWYRWSNDYPKLSEQEEQTPEPTHHSHTRSTGTSIASIASFQAEQLARAISVGVDPTPYYYNQAPSISGDQSLTPSRTLKQGITGDDVKALQAYLNIHGYDCGILDGIFGLKTKQAVIQFQLTNGLVGDGIVGTNTRLLLK